MSLSMAGCLGKNMDSEPTTKSQPEFHELQDPNQGNPIRFEFLDDAFYLPTTDILARAATSIPVLRIQGGRKLHTLNWTSVTPIVLKELAERLSSSRLTGFEIFPTKLQAGARRNVGECFGLAITGKAGPLDKRLRSKQWCPPSYPGGPSAWEFVGHYFDVSTWDRCDFFTPAETDLIMLSQRATQFLQSINPLNARIVRAAEARTSDFLFEPSPKSQ